MGAHMRGPGPASTAHARSSESRSHNLCCRVCLVFGRDVAQRERRQVERRDVQLRRERAAGRGGSQEPHQHRVQLGGVDVARDVHLQRPGAQLRFHRSRHAVQVQRAQLFARRVHQPAVPEHRVVHLVVRQQLKVSLRVQLEHAVDVLHALQSVGVPHRARGKQVHDFERGS
jgi:hypothetical protein